MFSILSAAGWPIWPLLAASIIALALIVERFMALRRPKIVPASLVGEVVALVKKNAITADVITRLERSSPFGRILASGLRTLSAPREIMKEAIEESGNAVTHDLERYLTTLGTIASAAPLMGLFGTVVGMIEIFAASGANGTDPTQLAKGISIALYNTGFGLAIAIPTLIAYRHFRRLVDSLVNEMQVEAVKFVDTVHGDRRS